MPFWIKERSNPQLGTYFVACGKMKVKDAKSAGGSLYGSSEMHRFNNEVDYEKRLRELKESGERVHADGGHEHDIDG